MPGYLTKVLRYQETIKTIQYAERVNFPIKENKLMVGLAETPVHEDKHQLNVPATTKNIHIHINNHISNKN